LQEGFWLGLHPPVASLSEAIIVALVTGALALALRHEFHHDGSGRERTSTPRRQGSGRDTRNEATRQHRSAIRA
jgi:hypothetical protein